MCVVLLGVCLVLVLVLVWLCWFWTLQDPSCAGRPCAGPPYARPPKISLFFHSPATISLFFCLSEVFSLNCGHQNSTKRPQREKKNEMVAGEGKKRERNFAPPTFGAPPFAVASSTAAATCWAIVLATNRRVVSPMTMPRIFSFSFRKAVALSTSNRANTSLGTLAKSRHMREKPVCVRLRQQQTSEMVPRHP